jgi:hypothetical protein
MFWPPVTPLLNNYLAAFSKSVSSENLLGIERYVIITAHCYTYKNR